MKSFVQYFSCHFDYRRFWLKSNLLKVWDFHVLKHCMLGRILREEKEGGGSLWVLNKGRVNRDCFKLWWVMVTPPYLAEEQDWWVLIVVTVYWCIILPHYIIFFCKFKRSRRLLASSTSQSKNNASGFDLNDYMP